jgi:hypothetical protein
MNQPDKMSFESRSSASRSQILDALGVFGNLANLLIATQRNPENFESDTPALDGGTKAAVEASLILCCDRLDTMLRDESRWTMRPHDGLERLLPSVTRTPPR